MLLYEGDNQLDVQMMLLPPGEARLSGMVTDRDTGYPISGVKVSVDSLIAYTNAQGQCLLTGITPGEYTVRFEKEGYEPIVL